MFGLRILLSFIIPTWKLYLFIRRCIRSFQWMQEHNAINYWINYELPEVKWPLLALAATAYVIDSEYEMLPLPLFAVRCILDSWFVQETVCIWFRWAYNLVRTRRFTIPVAQCVKSAWMACITQFWLPICSRTISAFLIIQAAVLIMEAIVDEVYAIAHGYDPAPAIGLTTTSYWQLIAILKSTNNGYQSRQFVPVKICDPMKVGDPFWPDHVSSLCVVEIRKRNMIWTTIILWRLSLLDGCKKKVHVFNYIRPYSIYKPFARSYVLKPSACFESGSIVFVQYFDCIFVYDFSNKSASEYQMSWNLYIQMLLSIKCIQRRVNAHGSAEGYRMRCVVGGWTLCNCHTGEERELRASVAVLIIDLSRGKVRKVSEEAILFGSAILMDEPLPFPGMRAVRTSAGLSGLCFYDRQTGGDPTMLDDSKDRFVFFPTFDTLNRSDRRLNALMYTPPPSAALRDQDDLSPAIFNDRECVKFFSNDTLFRTEFAPPSLKYVAAQTLLRARPNLRREMNARQFRYLSGIEGMDHHFDLEES